MTWEPIHGRFHPDMAVLFAAREAVPTGETIEEQRRTWNLYAERMAVPRPAGMDVEDASVPGPAGDIPVRIYHPPGRRNPAPGVLYFHGGGFVKGDLDSSDSVGWGLAEEIGAVTVSVDYRLAPEHPYPAAFDDCYAVLLHVAAKAADYGIDPARLAVTGDSAGGNLAAAVAQAARDRGGPALRAQGLVYPVTGLPPEGGSYDENAEGPGLTTAAMRMYNSAYMTDPATSDPYARPVVAQDLTRLPPAYVLTAEFDPLRDDGEIYAGKLEAAGVRTVYRCARGMIHGFLRARCHGEGAAAEFRAMTDFLREQLDRP